MRVFGATELPALLDNPEVTRINGYAVSDLRRMMDDLTASGKSQAFAESMVLDLIDRTSAADAALLQVVLDADGQITAVGSRDYFKQVGLAGLGSDLPSGATGRSVAVLMDAVPDSARFQDAVRNAQFAHDYMLRYEAERYAAFEAAGDLKGLARSARYLNKLGVIGTVLGAAVVAGEAQAAYESGDTAEAERILARYAGESAGSWIGSAGMGAVVAPLLAFGPAGWLAWGVVTLSGGIVGGIVGEKATDKLISTLGSSSAAVTETQKVYVNGTPVGTSTNTSYANGVGYFQLRFTDSRLDADVWRIPLEEGGYREVKAYLHPELADGLVGNTYEYDANGTLVLFEQRTLNSSGTGMQVKAFAGDQQIATRVQQVIDGELVDVTFEYESSGVAHVVKINGINGEAVSSADQAIEALNATNLTPKQLASGQVPKQAKVVFDSYDPTRPSGLQTLLDGIGIYGPSVVDALTLVRAIQSDEPLPVVASGLRLANDLADLNSNAPHYELSGAANVASGVL